MGISIKSVVELNNLANGIANAFRELFQTANIYLMTTLKGPIFAFHLYSFNFFFKKYTLSYTISVPS